MANDNAQAWALSEILRCSVAHFCTDMAMKNTLLQYSFGNYPNLCIKVYVCAVTSAAVPRRLVRPPAL